MTPLRTLPIRVAPLPGEALDSWLEALAHRMHMPVGALLHSVGLNRRVYPRREGAPQGRNWMNGLQPDEASAIASVTGAAETTLTSMTLAAYDGRALVIDPSTRQVRRGILWGRNAGSRYCPSCLAESGGRWSLIWRLGWSFACLRHQCLLADTCPRCSRLQRMYHYRAEQLLHPAYCGYPAVGRTRSTRCETDLRETIPVFLGHGHPALDAQRLILEAIEAGEARFGVYASTPLPTGQALADVKAIAARALADASSSGLSSRLPADIRNLYEEYLKAQPQESRNLPRVATVAPGRMSPPRAVTAAAGVLAAIEVLGQPSIASAGLSLRWLTSGTRSRGQAATPTTVAAWRRGASTAMNAAALYSLQPVLRPSDQLRYRVVSLSPQAPDITGDRIGAVARNTPGLLWESWAVRIAVPEILGRSLRAALPVLVLITGTRPSLGEAAALLGNLISKNDASRILSVLQDAAQWLPVLTAITRLSDYLESQPAPIDYQRRRSLDYSGLLPGVEWDRICHATGAPPGSGRKERAARAYLRERVSMLPGDLTLPGRGFRLREELAGFLFLLFPELSAQLDQEALRYLATQGITGEPVTWDPPLDLITDLDLPGPDPTAIDIDHLHRLVHEGVPPSAAAETLGTTIDALRAVLVQHPAPARRVVKGQGPKTGPRTYGVEIPKADLERLYLRERLSIREIATLYHLPKPMVADMVRSHGIRLGWRPPAGVTPEWLQQEYVEKGRSFRELATHVDSSPSALAGWARKWGLPVRPRGGAGIQAAAARARLAAVNGM
jgi:hypothetical protein